MPTVPRPKSPRERVATEAELDEDTRRCREAREANRPLAPTAAPTEGNLCACLVTFAAWRKCNGCGQPCLYVDSNACTDSEFICGNCVLRRATLEQLFSRIRPCRVCGKLSARLIDGLCHEHHARLKTLALSIYPDRAERLFSQEAVQR